jgi:hypothetical protein
MTTGNVPFHEVEGYGVVLQVATGNRPARPRVEECRVDLSDAMWSLIQGCWCTTAGDRPTMAAALRRLQVAEDNRPHVIPMVSQEHATSLASDLELSHFSVGSVTSVSLDDIGLLFATYRLLLRH